MGLGSVGGGAGGREGNGGNGGYAGAGGNGRPRVVPVPRGSSPPRVHAASAGNGAHCHPPRTTAPHATGDAPKARRKFAGNARSVDAVSSRQKHAASLNARNLSQQDARAPSVEEEAEEEEEEEEAAAARVAAHPSCTKRTSSETAHVPGGGGRAGAGAGGGVGGEPGGEPGGGPGA